VAEDIRVVTKRQTAALVLGLVAIFVVALITGLGDTPVIVDQSRQPSTPTLSGSSVSTALITAALGFVFFVVGQFALKLFVEPIQEQARIVGEVTHALTYYRAVSSRPTASEADIAEARRKYRDLAARLRMNLRLLKPWYQFFARPPFVLPEECVRQAATSLVVLSSAVQKGPAAEDVQEHSHLVRQSLGIER
jgi:hypothetical protein